MIYFAGAGCGAADLITVRGMKLLEKADVVIYAGSLVNPELLSYTKEACEIYNSATMTLEEVIEVMRKAESESKMVVRLHTGEPSLYGAVREQMDCLDELGISYELSGSFRLLWCSCISADRIYTAGGLTEPYYYPHGRKNIGAGKREYREFCSTSGIHGDLLKYRYVRGTFQTSCGRWVYERHPGSVSV